MRPSEASELPSVALRWSHGRPSGWLTFGHPRLVLRAHSIAEVRPLLERVELAARGGAYCVGYLAYEAAPAFDSAFEVRGDEVLPLAWFGVFDRPLEDGPLPTGAGAFSVSPWHGTVDRKEFLAAVSQIRSFIARGETYQTNYTFRLRAELDGDPWGLFLALCEAQEAQYATYLDTGQYVICSASPELFFALEGGRIMCRPMKGTAPRGLTAEEDDRRAQELRLSDKDRAENLMIVDMVRNDLGRVARTGSVRVTSLFDIEKYESLYQMTSTVEAETDATLDEVLAAMFPCASITGAPKIRTMKLIADLETTPRGIYTGALGLIAPGGAHRFSVAIRTIVIDRQTGTAEYGTGGGIVWDSVAEREHEECRTKALLLSRLSPPKFALLETLLWEPESGYFLLDRHLDRLAGSARYFDFPVDRDEIRRLLEHEAAHLPRNPQKVRLIVPPTGRPRIESSDVSRKKKSVRLALAGEPIDREDPFLYHKTTRRELYERARRSALDSDDVLLWNVDGEVTESTVANLAVRLEGRWLTPAVECGLLPGTFRAELLDQGRLTEARLTKEDLIRASEIWLLNSVRRWIPARLQAPPARLVTAQHLER